jgi:hypothetical protein
VVVCANEFFASVPNLSNLHPEAAQLALQNWLGRTQQLTRVLGTLS